MLPWPRSGLARRSQSPPSPRWHPSWSCPGGTKLALFGLLSLARAPILSGPSRVEGFLVTVPASRPGVSRRRLHVPPPSPQVILETRAGARTMGQDSVSGIVWRLAETCPLPALHDVDVQSGVKRLSSQPSVPVKALPVLLWAPRLKTGVVKSTLNDGSHQSHRTALPCLKRGPPPSVLPPHTHPSSRSQTWASLQGTTRSSAASRKSTIGRRYVPLGNLLVGRPDHLSPPSDT